ncbi:LPXTG cell wall anchor domain-containing protein [Ruania alba]|nr:LPXTG cell wall anchor domain-containing protein [Ruania alba]
MRRRRAVGDSVRRPVLGWLLAVALGLAAPVTFTASAVADEQVTEDVTETTTGSEATEPDQQVSGEPPEQADPELTEPADPEPTEQADPEPTEQADAEPVPEESAAQEPAQEEQAEDTPTQEEVTEDILTEEDQTEASTSDETSSEEGTGDAERSADEQLSASNEISPLALEPGCPAWPVGTPAGFEIDGNLCTNGASDWSTVGGQPAAVDGYDDATQFTGGSKENNWPWSAAQTSGSGIAPGKTDMGNVYAFSTTAGGDVYAFLAFERQDNTGSTSYHVELNQLPNSTGPVPDRSIGDLRLKIEQTGNVTLALLDAHTWNGSAWVSLGSTAGFVGQINQDSTFNLANEELLSGSFGEVAVNLTTLFGDAGCSGEFGTVNVRSSSSPEETSSLGDWIAPISLNVPSTCASVQVDKTWVIDGDTFDDGDQPFGTASLSLTDQDTAEFGTTYTQHSDGTTDYEAGDVVTIGEQVTDLPPGCTNVPSGDLGDHSLTAGLNSYTVTNTVTCTYLTLVKNVVGEADPAAWTLTAVGPTPLSGSSGSAAVTTAHVESGVYTIGETGGPDGYQQTGLECTPIAADGDVVTVAPGEAITCTVTNTAEVGLQVLKTWFVDGEEFADGDQPVGEAQLTLDGVNADFGIAYDGYLVGTEVTVAEEVTGLPEACGLVTTIDGVETLSVDHTVTLTPDPNLLEVVNTVTCTQTLTLVKDVAFGSALPEAWTLTAAGPEEHTVTGASGSPEVTGQVVVAAEPYALSESDGPITYLQSGDWVCVDGQDAPVEVTGGAVTVAYGADVTCTVTNTTAMITLLKHIDDGSTDVLSPDDWTLTATPDCAVAELAVVEVTGAETESAANTAEILPDCSYILTEELAAGSTIAYRELALEVWDDDTGEWTTVVDNAVQVAPGTHATYRFVNDAPPAVTLPLTGGTSTDAVLLTGLTLLVLAGGLVVYQWRRRAAGPVTP